MLRVIMMVAMPSLRSVSSLSLEPGDTRTSLRHGRRLRQAIEASSISSNTVSNML